jgi:GLPGLI family protein
MTMKTIIIILVCLLFTGNLLFAQHTKFTTSGTIEFEKSVNIYGLAKQQLGKTPNELSLQLFEAYKKANPQFKKLHSTLIFNGDKTLYTPVSSTTNDRIMGNDNPGALQFNLIYTDLAAGLSTVQKSVYEDVYLLKDSIRKIHWKITDETREIAGYTCRRANALIMDSVYVVAFYTNEIHVSGGPESFTGLPGMILGVALPHDNFTWFATKVTDTTVPDNTIVPPKKGKPINNKKLLDILKEAMKSWGDTGPYEMKVFSL